VKRLIAFAVATAAGLAFVGAHGADAPATDRAIRLKSPKAADVYSEQRVALVIGNGAYATERLLCPPNDADDIAGALRARKFDVTCVVNADKRRMKDAIADFGKRLKAGGVGLFYYAGHGVQRAGKNYLFPIDAEIRTAQDVEDEGVSVNQVLSAMEEATNRLNFVILDACRDNPYPAASRDGVTGLAAMKAPAGTLIAFATAEGKTAGEGIGRNGIYTRHLIEQLNRRGLKAEDLFKAVREGVTADTSKKQVPWDHSSLIGDFYFTPVDFDDGRMALSEAELRRLRQLEEEQRKADEEKARVEAASKAKQAELDREIAKLKAQLKVESTSKTLDALATVAEQRERLDTQLREAQRKADEERRNREAAIAQLKAQERANRKAEFDKRYAVYTKAVASRFLSDDEKAAAWKAICDEWRVTQAPAKPGQLEWDDENGSVFLCAGGIPLPRATDKTMTIDLGGGVKMEMVWVEALKGWVGKYEVTNDEYRRFKNDHDSGKYVGRSLNEDRQPVVNVSYDEAVAFAEWVNGQAKGLPAGYSVRLPDGKEWMTFAQCGDGRTYPWGNDWPPKYGNYADATAKSAFSDWTVIEGYRDGSAVSCAVEQSGKNDWGLYGVGGNVWEWTNEQDGSGRVLRGASWFNYEQVILRCEYRSRVPPSYRFFSNGFRLVVLR
jgi:uncharacterized caspase-like protein